MKHLTLINVRTAVPVWLLYNISVYKNRLWKIKNWDQFLEILISPCRSLSQTLAKSPSGAWSPACLLIMPGLLSPTGEASVSPLLRENGRTPAAYVSGASFLSWSFIGFPHKPSYSASFLHWIFLLSYPHSITPYISNYYLTEAIVSWSSPTPFPLRIPWVSWGWTLADQLLSDSLQPHGLDCSPPDSSVLEMSQARILEWVAISSSRVFSGPRDSTLVSRIFWIASGFFTPELLGKHLSFR